MELTILVPFLEEALATETVLKKRGLVRVFVIWSLVAE
jgi:hypothetical protein